MMHGIVASQLIRVKELSKTAKWHYVLGAQESPDSAPNLIDEWGNFAVDTNLYITGCSVSYPGGDYLVDFIQGGNGHDEMLFSIWDLVNPDVGVVVRLKTPGIRDNAGDPVRQRSWLSKDGFIHVVYLRDAFDNDDIFITGGYFKVDTKSLKKGVLELTENDFVTLPHNSIVVEQGVSIADAMFGVKLSEDHRWVIMSWAHHNGDKTKYLYELVNGNLVGPYSVPHSGGWDVNHTMFTTNHKGQARFLVTHRTDGSEWGVLVKLYGVTSSGGTSLLNEVRLPYISTGTYFINPSPDGRWVMMIPSGGCGGTYGTLLEIKDNTLSVRAAINWQSGYTMVKEGGWWHHDSSKFYFSAQHYAIDYLDVTKVPAYTGEILDHDYFEWMTNQFGNTPNWLFPVTLSKDIGPQASTLEGVVYTLNMTDTYGDGWNGGRIVIFIDGVAEPYSLTLGNGSSGSMQFAVPDNTTFELQWYPGAYDDEVGMRLTHDASNTVVFQFGDSYLPFDGPPTLLARVSTPTTLDYLVPAGGPNNL